MPRVPERNEYIQACLAVGIKGTPALKLYRQLGGRVRTQEFIREWQALELARGEWAGVH